jgi:hypothetical protein
MNISKNGKVTLAGWKKKKKKKSDDQNNLTTDLSEEDMEDD